MNSVVFKLADDRSTVLLEIQASSPPPDAAALKDAFEASEFSGYYLVEDALANVLTNAAKSGNDAPVTAVVAQRRDAELKLKIAADGLTATCSVIAAYRGKNITTLDVAVACRTGGVTNGLVMHNIAELVSKARAAQPGDEVNAIIAEGLPPVDGEDARLEPLAETIKDRVLKPRERADGTVDMHDLGDVLTVEAGAELMRRHPPRPGKDGLTVTGERIAHKPGEDCVLAVGEGSRHAAEDANLLLATRAGIPCRSGDTMDVSEVLSLDRVDLSTGNVDFQGCVLVKGDVAEDMRVHATGDISIGGVVESAVVEADGDLLVHDGIIGHQIDAAQSATAELSARLRAGGDLVAKYAQNAELQSKQSVRIAKYLFHSQVTAGDVIWIGGERRPDGRLVGGKLVAGHSVQAGFIGAEAGTRTQIDLSPLVAEVQERLDALKATMHEDITLHNGLVNELKRLKLAGAQSAPRRKELANTLKQCRQRFEQNKKILLTVEQEKVALLGGLSVVAYRSMYSGTRISLLDDLYQATWEHGPSKVVPGESGLQSEPLAR